MSICPKNKSSRSHVCRNCGSYNKKTVIEVED